MDFRYNEQGCRQDEELSRILSEHKEAAEGGAPVRTPVAEGTAFERLQNSPLDEVKHIIEQKGKKAAAEALGAFQARERLLTYQQSSLDLLDIFLEK